MSRYTYRTKIETAILTVLLTAASFWIHLGQAGESSDRSHKSAQCSLCHVLRVDITSDQSPVFDPSSQCRTCHQPLKIDEQSKLTFHQTVRKCTDCHDFHNPSQITAGTRSFRYRFDARSAQRAICFSCHGNGESFTRISEGHKKAAELFHSNYQYLAGLTPSQACMLCHGNATPISSEYTVGLAVPRLPDHNDHPLGVVVKPGSGRPGNRIRKEIDPRLRLFDGRIECQSCHSLSAPTSGRLVSFSSFTDLCLGCHQVD